MFEMITLSTAPGLAHLTAECRECGWRMAFSTWRMDIIVKTVEEHAPHAVASPEDICYSRVMTETGNSIQAQAGAVKALADAFDREIQTNGIANIHQARAFIATWAAAVAALAPPQEPQPTTQAAGWAPPEWFGDTEPPVGSIVRDRDGDLTERTEEGWDGVGDWSDVQHYAPLTIIRWGTGE